MTNLERLKLELAHKDYFTDTEFRVFLEENGLDADYTYNKAVSRPRQHRHLKRKNSILFLVFLDFPHFFIHSGWQDTLF